MIDKMSTSKYQRWRSTIAHAEGWYRQHLWWNEYLWKRTSSVWIFWCDCCWQSNPLSLCDHHIRLSPASLQNSTSSPPAQQPDTCSQCFFSRIRGWRASATSCKMADGACRWRLNQNASVFPSLIFVAQNVQLYLQPLLPRALCLTIITASIHLYPHHLLRFRSYASGFMLKKLKEEAPFIRLSTLSNYFWTQVRKLWFLNIGYQSTRLLLQWCCCANHRFMSHSREWQKLDACFGSSVKSRWVLLSWRSLIQLLQMKYPPPLLLHHPLRSSRRVSGLAWWVSWRRQVLAAYLKWSLPSISVSLMLKDASPAEILDQARSTLYSQQRSSWMAARASLCMRPSMV